MAQTLRPPSTLRSYDVCVVGSQLGGIAAGALLARRGFRVLHVDHDGLGWAYDDGGYRLPYAPALLPSPRLLPAAEAVLEELSLLSDVGRVLEPCAPDLQVLLPRHRLDLWRADEPRLAELKREFGVDADRVSKSLAEAMRLFDAERPFLAALPPLPPRGLAERIRLSRARRHSPDGADGGPVPLSDLGEHPLGAALRGAYPFLAHVHGSPPRLGLARVLGAVLRGTHRTPWGDVGLREILRRRIAESRGDLLGTEDSPVAAESLDVERGRVAAVRLADSDDVYAARAFICATDAQALRRIVPGGGEKLAAQLDLVRPVKRLLAVNWVVRTGALPAPLGPAALACGTQFGDPVLLQVLPALRSGKKSAGEPAADQCVLAAAAFVPVRTQERDSDRIAEQVSRIRSAVAEFLPFFDRQVLHESVPLLASSAERRGTRLLPHPLYEIRRGQVLGVTGLPTRSALPNLFFAGREVLPGLGFEGEFHAALQAANRVETYLGKKPKPK
ncbi:MAG TPA: NAD(P)-binding protein [Anaeromyxobacteraceae bacterium]|nr:NAD(P)-binding protein [Anaeromyxobacteraceae bacterium]